MRGRRMKKLFDAINLLAQPYGATIKDLAKRLETTERQAYRTIETLQDDFHFIFSGDNGRVIGYDNRHGHHRHFRGTVETADTTSFEEIERRFELEWIMVLEEYNAQHNR